MRLTFEEGTLLLRDDPHDEAVPPAFVWDPRVDMWRAQALAYRGALEFFKTHGLEFTNTAPRYNRLKLKAKNPPEPHPHQRDSMTGWRHWDCRGVVVLPTGAGKSQVGLMAIEHIQRSTLVIAPTIDLMNQWYDLLTQAFEVDVGLLGGGYHELLDLTVATYDSAYMHMERYGNRFGLLIFDEVHHLPGEMYSHAAQMSLAPYRMGLSATPQRADGRHVLLDTLVGPIAYEKGIRELTGEYLAEYRVERRQVEMVAEERQTYETARHEYHAFLDSKGVKLGSLNGWQRFVQLSARSSEGRRAMLAYRRHRKIALGTSAKLRVLEDILKAHPRDRILVFTNDNETVYEISQTFLVPAITHQTRTRERKQILEAFNQGEYLTLVTSKVLNEGVNIPDANVAVILSGSATIREHVQRLGRILRQRQGKQAILYEVISKDTVEDRISSRRRQHPAYIAETT
jgi:superfamily II DNA or RNA helicase